jgi:hypothetical protein
MGAAGLLWLWRGGAIVLALAAGWLLGRTPPDWRGDSEVVGGGTYTPPDYYASPLLLRGRGFFSGSWLAAACTVAALALIYFGWPEAAELSEKLGDSPGSGAELFLTPGLWIVLGAWLAGWVLSRVSDKGPVGPLE